MRLRRLFLQPAAIVSDGCAEKVTRTASGLTFSEFYGTDGAWISNLTTAYCATRCPEGWARASGIAAFVGDYAQPLLAEPLDAEPHLVTDAEKNRLGFDPETHARRRAGGDDIARHQRHEA